MLAVAHAHHAAALQHQAGGLGVALHAQVGPPAGRFEKTLCRAAAPALVRGELVVAGAFLRGAVEVFVARHADVARASDEGLDEFVLRPDVRDPQRPLVAVKGAGTALVGL